MTSVSDSFLVSKTGSAVVRECPFCGEQLQDESGKDINFIVHLGTPTPEHRTKQAWADYVTAMHRV